MAKKIRLFDTQPSMGASPSGIEDYVSGASPSAMDTYNPRQPGLLTGLGRALSGFSAPYVGDMDWAIKQAQIQATRDAADMEFQKYLLTTGKLKSIYTIDPVTGLPVSVGQIPKGSQVVPQSSFISSEEKMQQDVRKSELLKSAEILPKMDQALEAFNMLKGQFYSAVTPSSVAKGDIKAGLKARVAGVGKAAEAAAGASPDLQVFKNNRGAFASLISKGGFLEAGVLTNQDIERVLKAVPNEFSTKEEADKGWSTVSDILGRARKKYESKLNVKPSTPKEAETFQTFDVGGKKYNIPADKVDAFKKAKGIK